jgi:hypothetical protein
MVVLAIINSVYLAHQNRVKAKALLIDSHDVKRGEGDLDIHFNYIT